MCLTKVTRKHFPNSCFKVSQNIYPLVSCHIFWPQYLNHLKQAEWSTSYQSDLPKNIQYFILVINYLLVKKNPNILDF